MRRFKNEYNKIISIKKERSTTATTIAAIMAVAVMIGAAV
jgi:hypothetical protein